MAMTGGTNQPATRSARRWIGARLRCASATICTICASIVSLPTCSARMTKLPLWLTVPPMTRAPASLSTGIDSPVIIDLSIALLPSTISPSTGTLSPGRTRRRSPTATCSSGDVLVRPVGADASGGLRRKVEQRADRPAGPVTGAQFEHLAEQDQHGDDGRGLEIDRDAPPMSRKAGGKTPGASIATTL